MNVVEEAVIWFNPKLGRWVFTIRILRRKILGIKVRLEYSAVLPRTP